MFREDRLLLWLTVALSVASLVPMLVTPFLPLVDLGSHIGAAGLLDDLITGSRVVSERYAINTNFLPYWVGYVLMGVLDAIGGPFFSAKATVAVTVLLLPLGHMRLLQALGRSPRLGLWAFIFAWDINTYWGWFTFQLGMGLALWAFAWIVEANSPKEAARVIPLTALVGLTHVHAVAWVGVGGILLALAKTKPHRALLNHAIALGGFSLLLPWALPKLFGGGGPGNLTFIQTPFPDKISQLHNYSMNTLPAAVTLTLTAMVLAMLAPAALGALDPKPPVERSSAMAVAIGASCMLLYFGAPFQISGSINHFWTFPRYATYIFLSLLLLPSVTLAGRKAWLLAPGVALVLAMCWERTKQFSEYGDRTRPYLEIIEAMKPDSKFLPMDYEFHFQGFYQPTLGQLHGYAAAARSSYDPHLFDIDMTPILFRPEGRPPEPHWWKPAETFSMDGVGRFYDYIIVHPRSRDTQLPPGTVELVKEAGEWRLYAVKKQTQSEAARAP